jgi:hypothetical protein
LINIVVDAVQHRVEGFHDGLLQGWSPKLAS